MDLRQKRYFGSVLRLIAVLPILLSVMNSLGRMRLFTWKSNDSPLSAKPIPIYALFPPSPSTLSTKYLDESSTGST